MDGRTHSQYASTPKDLENLIDRHKSACSQSRDQWIENISPLRRGEQIFYTSRYSFQDKSLCQLHIIPPLTHPMEPERMGLAATPWTTNY